MTPPDSGFERRKNSQEDHDLLIQISNNLRNMVSVYENHVQEDKEKHTDFEVRLRFLEKSQWIVVGAVAIIQFAIKFIFK